VIARAWDEARRLGHHWVGEEHVLLALAGGDDPAGGALREAGATVERLEALLAGTPRVPPPPADPHALDAPAYTPAVYAMFGRAEGLALARGVDAPEPTDVLVALLWRARLGASMLERLEVARSGVLEALAERGVPLPPGEPEAFESRPVKRVDVPFDKLPTILRDLPALLPPPGGLGFNLDRNTRRAWVFVDDDVDGEELVAAVLAAEEDPAR
jgi:hypothetical protein